MRSSHSLDRIDTAFDGAQLVAGAGLLLPATLAAHLGLKELVGKYLHLGKAPGRANVGDKLMTLIFSALAGGDCIDDAAALQAGGAAKILGFSVKAPPPRWVPSCGASAGATSASSTPSAAISSGGSGRREPDPAMPPSRSISTPRSARRTA
jgi:hypothetical protein